MEISWALNINHLNCLNLLNLRNCSIFQSINKGLGEGIKRRNPGEKSYVGGIFLEVFGVEELRFLWLQRSPCFRRWVVTLSHSLLLIKRGPYSKCVLNIFHVSLFDEYFLLITLYIVHLTCNIYMYKIVLGGFTLCRWRRCIPESFGEEHSGRRQSLDQPSLIGWVHHIFLFPFFTLKSDCLQFLRVSW